MDRTTGWLAAIAGLVVVAVVAVWIAGGDDSSTDGEIVPDDASDAVEDGADEPDSEATPTEAVAQLQRDLTDLDYYVGPIDGVYSEDTIDAIRAFQEASGIDVDGIVGPTTNAALSVALGRPTSIVLVQGAFAALCFFGGDLDGEMSARLSGAIARFQQQSGLEADARYGPTTAMALADSWPSRPDDCPDPESSSAVDALLEGAYLGFDVDGACAVDDDALLSVSASSANGASISIDSTADATSLRIDGEGVEVDDPAAIVTRDGDGGFEIIAGGMEVYVPSALCGA